MDRPPEIERGAELLGRGGVVAFPTDTVYGLGAHIFVPGAVARVFAIKGRPLQQPLPVLVAGWEQVERLAGPLPPTALVLGEHFWPGALTLVLAAAAGVPQELTAGTGKIALRIPRHPVPLGLIQRLGAPITGTSANLSGQPSPTTAQEVRRQLGDRVDLIIEGGPCPGVESTIVDLTAPEPQLLRAGAIPWGEIARVLNVEARV